MGFAFAFVVTALVLSFALHNREAIGNKFGFDLSAIPLYGSPLESWQDRDLALNNYGISWADFWEFIHRSWTSLEETTSKYVPSKTNENLNEAAGRRETGEAARLFVEGAKVLFPGEDEFVQRLGFSFLSKQDKNKTNVMHFVGTPRTGKNRTAMLLARSLFPGPPASFSSTFQNNEQARTVLDNLSANLDTFESGLVLILRNYVSGDESTWSSLFNLVTSPRFVESQSLLIFIEDVGSPRSHKINVRLSPFTDLNDARDLIRDKLSHIFAKKETAKTLLELSTIVPFVPKSVRTIEAYIKRVCENLGVKSDPGTREFNFSTMIQSNAKTDNWLIAAVVCDTKALAQAAVKLEPCVENEGFYTAIDSLEKVLKHALISSQISNASSCENGGKGLELTSCSSAVLAYTLEVDVTESSSCDEKGMESWLEFVQLEPF